jgi:UDPglucose 6-dehydrogenase
MKVTVVGAGYVGLVTATCLADSGNHVLGVDSDEEKVQLLRSGRSPFYEPGLEELLRADLSSDRLRFTSDLDAGAAHGRVIFIAAGTPPKPDGSADLSDVSAIVRRIAEQATSRKVVVLKSTVPVGTARKMGEMMGELTTHPVAVVSNPEFLREGTALNDFLRPDRVIIGSDDAEAIQLMRELYAPFVRRNQNIMVMSSEAAEMVKYAANAYLAARISFINEIADICARTGVDINEVRAGMGADRRIGAGYLFPGVGYGGSCFPKDVQALIHMGQQVGAGVGILENVHTRNERQKQALVEMVLERFGKKLEGRTLGIWGLAFKPNTDDIREAPAIYAIRALTKAGARMTCYDPKACENARTELSDLKNVSFVDDPYEALQGADGLIICTEWNEFRTPDFDRIRADLKEQVIFDGRNLYAPETMLRERIEYHSIGRGVVAPSERSKPAAAKSKSSQSR